MQERRVSCAIPQDCHSAAHLRPDLEHVLEPNTCIGEFTLQHHDDIVVVFRDLLTASLIQSVFRELLQLTNLLIQRRDVLLDDVCEFLNASRLSAEHDSSSSGQLTLISTGRSSNSVFLLATVHR